MTNPLKAEPAGIAGAIAAIVNALILLNVLSWTVDQAAAVNIAIAAVLAVIVRQTVTSPLTLESDYTPVDDWEPTP